MRRCMEPIHRRIFCNLLGFVLLMSLTHYRVLLIIFIIIDNCAIIAIINYFSYRFEKKK